MRWMILLALLTLSACSSSYKHSTMPYWGPEISTDRTPASIEDEKKTKKKHYTHPKAAERYPFRY